jgi:hypothetical protein
MYKKAYDPVIYLMPSKKQWVTTQHDMLEPPIARVAPGRPKKLRKMGVDESRDPKNPHKMRKFEAKTKCSKCRARGHNKRVCPINSSQVSVELPTPPPTSVSFLLVLLSLILSCTICKLMDHLICFICVNTKYWFQHSYIDQIQT